MKLANTAEQYIRLGESAPSDAFIYDASSWSLARRKKLGPLGRLSKEALDQFENSMRFKEECLVSAHCAEAEHDLDMQVGPFFELFGIGPDLLGSAWPMQCTPKGCARSASHYCFFHKTGCNLTP